MATVITALPPVPSRSNAPDLFADRADAFLGALPTFREELNALGVEIEGAGGDAAAQVVLAEAQVALATAQADIATTQAGLALTRAGDANTSAVAASISAGEALTSANTAAGHLADFELQYLGSKSSDPLLDNSGGALVEGQFYWHSGANELRFYNGSTWTTANLVAAGYLAKAGDAMTGSLTFNGTGLRLSADLSNATLASRFLFQSNTTNGSSSLGVIPNGTSGVSSFRAYSASTPTNASVLDFSITHGSESRITSAGVGSGSVVPLTVYVGTTERMRITTNGDIGINNAAPVANANQINLHIKGITDRANLSLETGAGDGTAVAAGTMAFYGGTSVSSATEKRIVLVGGITDGATANNRGGALTISTKANNSNTLAEHLRVTAAGFIGLGQSSPVAKVDVSGNYASNIVSLSAGVGTIDCSLGNFFTTSVTSGTLTITFSNVPTSRAFSVTVEVTHTAGTIAFAGSVVFPNSGTAPTLTAGKRHVLGFITSNGGTTWSLVSSTNYNT